MVSCSSSCLRLLAYHRVSLLSTLLKDLDKNSVSIVFLFVVAALASATCIVFVLWFVVELVRKDDCELFC